MKIGCTGRGPFAGFRHIFAAARPFRSPLQQSETMPPETERTTRVLTPIAKFSRKAHQNAFQLWITP
jgi:hypothetical protein